MTFEIPQNFIFDRGEIELITVSGPDGADFLNRLSTLNFKKPIEGSSYGAFLNGQAKLISLFTVWEKDGKKYFFIEKEMLQKTKEYLEQMHFSENLKIETEKYFCVETRGQNNSFPSEMCTEAYNWGLAGKYFFSHKEFDSKGIAEDSYDAIRASFGFPKPLRDLTNDHIVIEASVDNMIDRHKGCYPGQEVIEKIYTYGRIPRKIKKIVFENANEADVLALRSSLPLEIKVDGNGVGFLSSAYHLDKGFGLATLKRLFYEKHQTLQISLEGKILNAHIVETGPVS